jgi:hypothetical protein
MMIDGDDGVRSRLHTGRLYSCSLPRLSLSLHVLSTINRSISCFSAIIVVIIIIIIIASLDSPLTHSPTLSLFPHAPAHRRAPRPAPSRPVPSAPRDRTASCHPDPSFSGDLNAPGVLSSSIRILSSSPARPMAAADVLAPDTDHALRCLSLSPLRTPAAPCATQRTAVKIDTSERVAAADVCASCACPARAPLSVCLCVCVCDGLQSTHA